MMTRLQKIREELEQDSRMNYEKTARRMRTAVQIADAMEKLHMSKKELADRMHKSPSEITKWLSGTHNFTSDVLSDLSYILGTEINGNKKPCKKYQISNNSYTAMTSVSIPSSGKKYKINKRKRSVSTDRFQDKRYFTFH